MVLNLGDMSYKTTLFHQKWKFLEKGVKTWYTSRFKQTNFYTSRQTMHCILKKFPNNRLTLV